MRQATSVAIATGLYGLSFGALSVAAGLSVLQTQALSLLMFTGGSQFAFVGVIGAGGGGVAAAATATLLGARNALYGAVMAPLLDLRGARRLLAAHVTIDESTAVATAQRDLTASRVGFWWAGLGVLVLWNVFTLAGALLGNALGDPGRWGLDAAAAAAFLGLLWPRLAARSAQLVAAGAVVVALVLTPVAPAGVPVLAAAVVAVVIGWRSPPGPSAVPGVPGTEDVNGSDEVDGSDETGGREGTARRSG
ncbi:AzlC family ABC transporter permease [Actinotalea sp. M2MS4P-6]|nr:AzlC family ABC transporter permease [Actinotalea sp. M2MS4P-6]MCV2396134.1 AzlC family ABC transporter permease [Actinotalea sp. M2MS4P-6]